MGHRKLAPMPFHRSGSLVPNLLAAIPAYTSPRGRYNAICESSVPLASRLTEAGSSYIFAGIFLIAIIHARGDQPRAGKDAKSGLGLIELTGQ